MNGRDASSSKFFVDSLRWDPLLALWCVCQAGEYFQQLPSADQIAQWFFSRGLVHFVSAGNTSEEAGHELASDDLPVNELIESAVTTAVLASRKKPDESVHLPRSYLLGLLIGSTTVLKASAGDRHVDASQGESLIPAWLARALNAINSRQQLHDAPPQAAVQRSRLAIEVGTDNLEADDRHIVSESGRRALQRFQARVPAARGGLPVLCSKLLRLQKLEMEFQATLEREKLASLKQLAYGASHEINNPLANISTRAQTLLRDEQDPERRRQLSTINNQAFRAHEMISDMMLFAHPPKLRLEATDVRALLERVVEESDADAGRQDTRLHLQIQGDLPMWDIDPIQITVALKALIRNSIQALGSRGQVVASLRLDTDDTGTANSVLEISVTDDGPGISTAVRRHLFDPFFSGREAGRGLGFGLAKCWRIVEMHRGEILVDSRPGYGATFAIRLPRAKSPESLTAES